MDGDLNALSAEERALSYRAHQMFTDIPMVSDGGFRRINAAWLAVRDALGRKYKNEEVAKTNTEMKEEAKGVVFRFLTEIAAEENGTPFPQPMVERKLKDRLEAWQKEIGVFPKEPREVLIARGILNLLENAGSVQGLMEETASTLESRQLSHIDAEWVLHTACLLAGKEVANKRDTEDEIDVFRMPPDALRQLVATHMDRVIENESAQAIWRELPQDENQAPILLAVAEAALLADRERMRRKGDLFIPRNLIVSHICHIAAQAGIRPQDEGLHDKVKAFIPQALDAVIEQRQEALDKRVECIRNMVDDNEVLHKALIEHAKRTLKVFVAGSEVNDLVDKAIAALAMDQINAEMPEPESEGLLDALKESVTNYYQAHKSQWTGENRGNIAR